MKKAYGTRLVLTMVAVVLLSSMFGLVAQAEAPDAGVRLFASGSSATITATIRGIAFQDWDQNGEHDAFEPTLAGVEVALYDLMGGKVTSAVTGDDGAYAFENLAPGGYILVESAPLGYSILEGTVEDMDADTAEIEMPVIAALGEPVEIDFGHVLLLGA